MIFHLISGEVVCIITQETLIYENAGGVGSPNCPYSNVLMIGLIETAKSNIALSGNGLRLERIFGFVPNNIYIYIYTRALRGGPLWQPAASLVGCMRCQVL